MNFDFYSDRSDAIKILEFIFCETDLVLFDLHSDYGQEVDRYESFDDAEQRLIKDASETSTLFQAWSPRHLGSPRFDQVKLNPQRCDGYTFRYSTLGFGMIQLYFHFPRKVRLSPSHIGHFEERGAYARRDFAPQDKVAAWDWFEIRRTSRRLKYHIQKHLAVEKVSDLDSRDILPGALSQFRSGVKRLHV